MSKKQEYQCQACQQLFGKWFGKCPDCGQWNTIDIIQQSAVTALAPKTDIQPLARLTTHLTELDQVMGGGFVPGSIVLLAGEPGIGKSTLLLQVCAHFQDKALYISGEESEQQIYMRAQRLGITGVLCIFVTNVQNIIKLLDQRKPQFVIIDSIQTLADPDMDAGAISQLKQCFGMLSQWGKANNAVMILVGHITKEGGIAGPKTLEHMVDVVLHFHGERSGTNRLLKSVKNRYGPTDETGVFDMSETGLTQVPDPSSIFMNDHAVHAPGMVIFPLLEGSKVMLTQIQALVVPTHMQMPRRTVVGWDTTRLSIIAAVIENRLKIRLSSKDIFVNVVGGVKVQDPGADLAVTAAILSSCLNKIIPTTYCIFGEVGLCGEVRKVTGDASRVKHCARLGYTNIIDYQIETLSNLFTLFTRLDK